MYRYFNNKSLRLVIWFVAALLLVRCVNTSTKNRTIHSLKEKEMQLDSLLAAIKQISDSTDAHSFVSIYQKAQTLAEQIPDSSSVKYKTLLQLTYKLEQFGGYHEAIEQGLKVIRLSDLPRNTTDNPRRKLVLTGKIAGLYNKTGNKESALQLYHKAVNVAISMKDTLFIASQFNNIGLFYGNQGLLDSALHYYHLAEELLTKISEKNFRIDKFQCTIRGNIATISFKKGDYKKAMSLFSKNYQFYKNLTNPKNNIPVIKTAISLARTELELNNTNRILPLLDSIHSILDTTQYKDKIINKKELFEIYQKYYERKGITVRAYEYADKILQINDSLYRKEKERILQTVTSLADYAKGGFMQDLDAEKRAQENLKNEARLQLWITILLALGAVSVFLYLFVFYRQKALLADKEKTLSESLRQLAEQKLNNVKQNMKLARLDLEYKKKDLAQMALHLKQKQDWSRELNNRLEELSSLRGQKRHNELKKLKSEIRSQITIDKEIKMLQQDVENLSTAFFEKIRIDHPELSKNDLKICSYIRLKLTNAQIAQLQNIDPSSVRISRYRLKKKLNLPGGADLETYLSEL